MSSFPRIRTPELMDDPAVDRDELERSLGYIRAVNRRLGGVKALLSHLDRWTRDHPKSKPISLLDIATGSADLPLAAHQWAQNRGLTLTITAVDNHAKTLDVARRLTADVPEITVLEADALELMDTFEPKSFTFVHAGLFLHHLSELAAMTVLRIMDRLAERGMIWNDLMRSRVGYATITLMTIGKPEIVKHDARVSVRAGFTKREAIDLARRVGWQSPAYRGNFFTHRFTVTSHRPA